MAFPLLRRFAKNLVKKGPKLLLDWVPGAGHVYEAAVETWEDYQRDQSVDALRAEVQALAQAPAAEVRQEVEQAVGAEAGDQPPEVRRALTAYLAQVPAAIRRSLRRPSDPGGITVPATMSFRGPEDLVPLLPPRPPRFKPGDRLPGAGDWELVEPLGAGGFGEVWLARHATFQATRAAVKFCLDDAARKRLLEHEGAVMNRVMHEGRHPGIVPLLDAKLDVDPPWLKYEYVEGGDLAGVIQELHASGPLPVETANRLFLRLVEIVAAAHRAEPPIVHDDLKPANVLVRRGIDGEWGLFVTDFGIGGLAADHAARESRRPSRGRQELLTEAVRGAYTPVYASPEQMSRRKGEPADPRDDVHALGVIWYQLLTGDLGMLSVPSDWREEVEGRGLGEKLLRLLASCIAPKAEKRPANAVVLAEELRAALPVPKGGQGPAGAGKGPKRRQATGDLSGQLGAALRGVVASSLGKALAFLPGDLSGQMEAGLRSAEQTHAEARRLAEEQHNYAEAVRRLEGMREDLRDNTLLANLHRAKRLDEEVRQAVRESRVVGLRRKVAALLELQPRRDDLRRLLERLPEPRPGEVIPGSLGMGFAWCPPGTFLMGSPRGSFWMGRGGEEGRGVDETQHQVTLTKGFYLGVHEVTQAQWQAVMGSNPSHFKGDDLPVEQVSWVDCHAFCQKLAARDGGRYRLPTEAEWEYACRAGTTTPFHFGQRISTGQANYKGRKTTPVGSFPANAWGLLDMHGNVWEWCQDWYGPYPSGDIKDPQDSNNGDARVVRGGSWLNDPRWCRSANRHQGAPGFRGLNFGCRVVLCLD
jgi:formylglycine-generating enzyme required for sulfatase activity